MTQKNIDSLFVCTIQMVISIMMTVPLEKDDRNVLLTLADVINNLP